MEHEAEPGRDDAESDRNDVEPGQTDAAADLAAADLAGASRAVTDGVPTETATEQTTGEPRVDAALKLLERLPGLPVSDHPELFEQVHARLSEVLDELESGSGATGPAGG
jgi:hypothetical protein